MNDLTVLALTPDQVAPAQEALLRWADEKLRVLRADLEEQSRAMEDAARYPFSNQQAQWRREAPRPMGMLPVPKPAAPPSMTAVIRFAKVAACVGGMMPHLLAAGTALFTMAAWAYALALWSY